ncbi:hypothetical protein IA69_12995 [Massilia sp. JS1662]|nr:hypothetical protein IA69_12995 [Massilia sp. JS1662]
MPIGPVLVPVVQPEIFPAAVQVVVVGLVVLVGTSHARIVANDDRIPVGLAVMGECQFGQFDDALAVERHVVLAQLREREPRFEHHAIERETAVSAQETEFGDVAVEIAQRPVFTHDGNRHHPGHHRLQGNPCVIGQEFDLDAEAAGDFFPRGHPVRQEDGVRPVAPGEFQAHQSVVLRIETEHRQCSACRDRLAPIHATPPGF